MGNDGDDFPQLFSPPAGLSIRPSVLCTGSASTVLYYNAAPVQQQSISPHSLPVMSPNPVGLCQRITGGMGDGFITPVFMHREKIRQFSVVKGSERVKIYLFDITTTIAIECYRQV